MYAGSGFPNYGNFSVGVFFGYVFHTAKVVMFIWPESVLCIGHLSAMAISLCFCSASKFPVKLILQIMSDVFFSSFRSKSTSTTIVSKAQFFLLAYMRKVIDVHAANEAANNSFGENPKPLPPLVTGSSETSLF